MLAKKSVNPPRLTADTSPRAALRDWLMLGNDLEAHIEGTPLLLWLLEQGWFDAATDALGAGANPNVKDDSGRGWLHRCVLEDAPALITLEGLRRLDHTWWQADALGQTPFHLPVRDSRLAQAMIVRWWAEQKPWAALRQPFDPLEAQLPQSAQWAAWRGLLRRY